MTSVTVAPTTVAATRLDARATQFASFLLCAALLAGALLLDPFANAAFDAPKRLLCLILITLAALCCNWPALPGWSWSKWSPRARGIVVASGLALLAVLLATLLSEQPELSRDSLRHMLIYGLLLPLGASAALTGALGIRLLRVAVWALGGSAVLSLLQAAGWRLPWVPEVVQLGGRFDTGALLGNEGYVALGCALLGAAAGALLLHPATRRWRYPALGLFVLAVITILVNRQLTSALALIAALVVLLAWRLRQAWVLPGAAGLVMLAAICAVVPSLRALTWEHSSLTVSRLQEVSTYRLAAWAAAIHMFAERPWTGFGPGSYASEGQAHRLAVEIELQERLTPAPNASGYVQAHQEYLQFAAECGVPALLAVLLALTLLFAGLQRLAWRVDQPEALLLLAVLSAAAVAALAWFPLQVPLLVIVILLACGRAWRLLAEQRHDQDPAR